uniref:Cilia- and flagella-associated protein 157 n=1 Tax=Biomphalaria glabrata TaxID=6526 RepID=A0A2C9KQH8_BIOGL
MSRKGTNSFLAKVKQDVPPATLQRGPPPLDIETKEHFLTIIDNLERRLNKYQKRCDELEVANGQFQEKFDQLSSDKKEIISFWKKQVEQKADEIVDLNDRYIGLQQARDNEREAFKKQIQEQRSEYQEMKDQLTAENMMLGGKLASLEEFKVQKEELMAKFALMEAELARKEEENKENLYNLEKKAVIDKDRLKKEMILRVNQVAAEFRKVSNKQMAETTKRTIRENVSITAQLAKMSDKTIEMIQENDELHDKVKKLKQQVEMLEFNEREMGKKNQSNLKVIKLMTDKCQSQEAVIAEYEKRENELMQLDSEIDILKQQNDSLRFIKDLSMRYNPITYPDQLGRWEEEGGYIRNPCYSSMLTALWSNQFEEKDDSMLPSGDKQMLAEAADAIKEVLIEKEDNKDRLIKCVNSTQTDMVDDVDESEETNTSDNIGTDVVYGREHMLEKLLVLMDSAANLGIGPNPDELGKRQLSSVGTLSNSPSTKKGIIKNEFPSMKGILPHYSLGDLGLVPRPSQHVPTSLEKTKLSAKTTKLGALHGVLSRSVSTQTMNAANSVLYANQILSKFPEHEILRSSHKPFGMAPPPIPKKITSH